MLRIAYPTIICLLGLPILAGTVIATLPAFGYFPAVGATEFTLNVWRDLLAVPGLTHSLLVSLLAGVVTPLLTLLIVFAFLASINGSRFDRWVRRLISPVLAIPHAAAAFGIAFLVAPAGLLSRWVSTGISGWERPPDLLIINDTWGIAMMAALVIKEIPFLLLMSLAALTQVNPAERVKIAQSLGYSPAVAWLKTVAPSLYPLVRLPIFAIIVFASANVDVALILGPVLPPTLSVQILQWFSDPDLSRRLLAAAAALLQLGISMIAILLWVGAESVVSRVAKIWMVAGQRQRGEALIRISGRSGIALALVTILGSLLALAINGFSGEWRYPASLPANWTLDHWANLFGEVGLPLTNTLLIGIGTSLAAVVLVIASLEWRFRTNSFTLQARTSLLLYMPLLIPQIVFLFGMVILSEFLQIPTGLLLVGFAHLLFVVPYIYLSLSEVYRHIDPRYSQVAASLGASPSKSFWRVRAPMVLAPILTACALGMAISISLFLPTQLIGAGRISTITTEALALASGGSRSTIGVWAMIQTALPALVFLVALFLPQVLWRNRAGMRSIE